MIRMTTHLLLLSLASLALPGFAQIYTWKDETGRTVMSDKPPVGKAAGQKTLRGSGTATADGAAATEGAPAAKPANAAKAGVDTELEKRKREQEARAKAENQQKEKEAAATRQEDCRLAKGNLAALEAGERIALRDEKGERYFMDDAQRANETQRLRGIVAKTCQ